MVILHVCSVENKMTNGATVAVLHHVNAQAKTGRARIMVCHVRGEELPWHPQVSVIEESGILENLKELDLVVFHEIYYLPFFGLAKKLRACGVPYVVVAHGGLTRGAQSQRRLPKAAVNALWAKRFIRGAAAVHFLSDQEASVSRSWCPRQLIAPNGVTIPPFQKEFAGRRSGLRFVYIGRFSIFYKGLDLLCQACGMIRETLQNKEISLHLYGPGEGVEYEKLKQLVQKYGLEEIIFLHDSVFGQAKKEALLAGDVFIQPSRSEGQPMGVLEALAAGLPVFVTPGTSFDTMVAEQRCGWVCACRADDIARTILRVYDERERLKEYSHNARAYTARHFAWEHVAEETLDLYQNIGKSRD